MADFERAFAIVVGGEGGYVNDPRDPGGETKFGISKRAYPNEDIASLTLERAKQIYRRDYWERASCDLLPWNWGLAVFDMAVNMGPVYAVKSMQAALGQVQDGIVGVKTLTAIGADRGRFFTDFMAARAYRYTELEGFEHFGRGWLRRVIRVTVEACNGA